jgi:hypothetical protein
MSFNMGECSCSGPVFTTQANCTAAMYLQRSHVTASRNQKRVVGAVPRTLAAAGAVTRD